MGRRSRYRPEFKADAVALVHASGKPVRKVAEDLGISRETLRGWLHQGAVDRGEGAPGELTSAEREELRRLRREDPGTANSGARTASGFGCTSPAASSARRRLVSLTGPTSRPR